MWPRKPRKISKESGFLSDEQLSSDRGSVTSPELSSDSEGEMEIIGERYFDWITIDSYCRLDLCRSIIVPAARLKNDRVLWLQ